MSGRGLVLVCDNEAMLRELVRETLEPEGFAVLEAADGEEALAVARQARPDVVLLDLMMPKRSGLDVLRELRRDPELAGTCVVVVTARAQAADREAVAAAGADCFLAKPFSPLALIALVEEVRGRPRPP